MQLSFSRGAWLLLLASVAVVGAALFVAAVTGGSAGVHASERSTAKQLDACAVFTMPDAQVLLGPSAQTFRPDAGGSCSYISRPPVASPGDPAPTLVTISVFDGEPLPVAQSYDGGAPLHDTVVKGVGSRARWYFYGHGAAGVLDVHEGTQVVRLMVGDAPRSNKETAVTAARVILSHLP